VYRQPAGHAVAAIVSLRKAAWAGETYIAGSIAPKGRRPRLTIAVDGVFAGNGTRVIRTPVRSPRANSYAEGFVGTLRRECLDHMLILGEWHLRSVVAEYARHYNGHRPHQGLQQEPPLREPGQIVDITARIERRHVLGGLISEYRRAA
jgi:putative transposase